MNHHHSLAIFSLAFLALAGCGNDSNDSAFNPATNVDLVFSTFDITEPLEQTLLWDFYRGVEPAPGQPDRAFELAAALRQQSGEFIVATPSDEDPTRYIRVRNPLDLMHQVIGENAVTNFNQGRSEISRLIDQSKPGEFNTTTNNVSIRFTDQSAIVTEAPSADAVWHYPILKWSYTPDKADNVIRVIQYRGVSDGETSTTSPSATYGSEFTSRDFSEFGYNAPVRALATLVIEGERELGLTQEFANASTDFLIIDGTAIGNRNEAGGPDFEFAGGTVDCARVELDYAAQTLVLYLSHNQPPRLDEIPEDPADPDATVANPDYCANLESATDSYQTVVIGDRA
ncbi:hypothetical protein [Marinobacter caseinilyticus]|uniref:hypothetical protein n=1 Tax=Marinobacter caseinilyticus TaxID=2692195 RepID=UPI00140D022E|nr:hypothetical protein [Marinobacter caseinilyticus]